MTQNQNNPQRHESLHEEILDLKNQLRSAQEAWCALRDTFTEAEKFHEKTKAELADCAAGLALTREQLKFNQDSLAAVTEERNAAQAALVEMRRVLEACDDYLAGARSKPGRELIKHALSAACGTGYVPVSELEPTIALLKTLFFVGKHADVKQELARLEALKGGKA